MEWYRLYKESNEEVDIKKLLKMNGVAKLPSGTEFKSDRISWEKRGGYAGRKTLDQMRDVLEDAGWKKGEWKPDGSPDGSWVSNSDSYTSPDGRIVMSYYSYYGATSRDNSYGFTFKLAGAPIVSEGDVSGKTMENYGGQLKYAWEKFEGIINQPHIDDYVMSHGGRMHIAWDSLLPDDDPYHRNHELYDAICQYLSDDNVEVRAGSNEWIVTFPDLVNESTIKGAGRVDFDDDLVAVYTPDGELEYKGLFDDCPYKDDDMRYDKTTMTYRIEGPNGDYRTMAKLAESSTNESDDWVGDDGGVYDDINPKFADLKDAFDKIDAHGNQWSAGKWRVRPSDIGVGYNIYYNGEGWVATINYRVKEYDLFNDKVVKQDEINDFLHACAADGFKPMDTVNESSRFGFKVGDRVVLTKDKSNRFSGDFIPAGTEGEIVAVDKPMPGVMKVKIEDWKTISVPERSLKLAGTDNEPWEKYKVPKKSKPTLDEILAKHGPEEIYNEPPPADGSPKWTGD